MRQQHAQAAIKDAIDCALAGKFDTAHALLDHAEELMFDRNDGSMCGQAAHLMDVMDSYERTSATAHLGDFHA